MSLLLLHLIFVTLPLDDYVHPDVLKSTYRSSIMSKGGGDGRGGWEAAMAEDGEMQRW